MKIYLFFLLFFIFSRAAPKFVSKWIGIVIIRIIEAVRIEGAETGIEKSNAPKIKSIWSAIGSEVPGDRFKRRLIKDSITSPIIQIQVICCIGIGFQIVEKGIFHTKLFVLILLMFL